jgi:hypothetical protein
MVAVLLAAIVPLSSASASGGGEPLAYHPVSLSLFPPISTNGSQSGNVSTNISLNIIGGYVGELRGFELGTLFNVEAYNAGWLQLAGGVNVVGVGSPCGGSGGCGHTVEAMTYNGVIQGCGGKSGTRQWGDFNGLQLAALGNFVMRDVQGVQLAAVNVAKGYARALQLGAGNYGGNWAGVQLGGVNLSWGGAGFQLGLFDLAREQVAVAQIGGVNVAGGDVPVKLGAINATGGSAAVQLGGINAARHNTGLTLGGVNFGGGDNGVAFGAVNVVGGSSILQLGGINGAGGDVGVQLGAINATGGSAAAQIGGFNAARHNTNFTLGGVNLGGGDNDVALGGVNVVRGSSKLQFGGINVLGNQAEEATVSEFGALLYGDQGCGGSDRSSGLQVGLFNVAGGSIGAQVGAVNLASQVRAFQFGAFNFARENDVAIGPLNVILNGQFRAQVYASEAPLAGFELKTGGRYFYNVLGFGYLPTDPARVMLGYGVGGHFPCVCPQFFVDADLVGYRVNPMDDMMNFDGMSYLAKLRATAGWEIAPRLSITGGLAANVWMSDQGEDGSNIPFLSVIPMYKMTGSTNIAIWPGASIGLEFRVI